MYRVLLVDDEIWSLKGLESSFEWEEEGFSVMERTTSSTEAMKLIEAERPDAVFTDIRMPELSGLDLLRNAREQGIESEFIIISGYAQFDYAQEAVKNGAFDYCLKPIDLAYSRQLLQRLREKLDQNRYRKDAAIFQRLFYEEQLPESMEVFRNTGCLQCIAVLGEEIPFRLWEGIRESFCTGFPSVVLSPGPGRRIILSGCPEEGSGLDGVPLRELRRAGAYVGISRVSKAFEEIPLLVREAFFAASGRFFGKDPGIYRFSESADPYYETYGKKICRLILENRYEEACGVLEEIRVLMKGEELGAGHIVMIWNQIALMLQESGGAGQTLKMQPLDFARISQRFQTVDRLCDYLKVILAELSLRQRDEEDSARTNENFVNLLQYVTENYCGKLSLSELAGQYYLNLSYCSELFKKVTGYTFSDYITRLRMEKAVALLSSQKYSVREAAYLTGYNDAFYFSKVFKKYHGVSPSHFLKRAE